MKWTVKYSAQAKADLWSTYNYIALSLQEPLFAERLVNRIMDAIDGLEQSPKRMRFQSEPWFSLGMRRINVGNYAVLFIPVEATGLVKIIRILYGRMDLERALEETDFEDME